jgi:hypothetical protein
MQKLIGKASGSGGAGESEWACLVYHDMTDSRDGTYLDYAAM